MVTATQILSGYRAFAFLLAVAQVLLVTPASSDQFLNYLLLSIIGIYTLIKVLFPLHPTWVSAKLESTSYRLRAQAYIIWWIDIVVCIFPLFISGGLSSSFLLYSLTPVLVAALLFPRQLAPVAASIASVCLITSQLTTVGSQFHFGSLAIYIMSSFFLALLPYTTNINLYRRLREDAIQGERKKLAREMHDTLAQTLAYLGLKVKQAEDTAAQDLDRGFTELTEIKQIIDATYDEVRETIDSLQKKEPVDAEIEDLDNSLTTQVNKFVLRTGIETKLAVPDTRVPLPSNAQQQLLRILQETLINVEKHAAASLVLVKLVPDAQGVTLTVKDNGCGFNLDNPFKDDDISGNHGLGVMSDRAKEMGGHFSILSTLGQGTEVNVHIPI